MKKSMSMMGKLVILVMMLGLSNIVLADWFFRGTPNNWATTQMTQVSGSTTNWETTQDFTGNTSPRFKIDQKGNWVTAYPAADYVVAAKKYKIIFNSSTKAITVSEVTVTKTVSSVAVSGTASIVKGSSVQLTAKTTYSDATTSTTATTTWSSSNTAVATVSAGKVTAVAKGTATITATVGGKSGTIVITVTEAAVKTVSSVSVSGTTSVVKGSSVQLTAKATYSDATTSTTATTTWSSSNTAVATVSAGKVTAVAKGTTTITATVGGKSGTIIITVTEAAVKTVSSVAVSGTASIVKGSSVQLTAKTTYSDATTSTTAATIWSSSNTSVATVSAGKVTAVAKGTATITATVGGKSGTIIITVTEATVVDKWYFRGTANNWVLTEMTQVTGTTKWKTTQDFTGNTSPRFKIDHKGDWTEAYPVADYTVSTKKYNITFDSSTKAIIAAEVVGPTVSANPAGGTYATFPVSVTLGLTVAAQGRYTIDGTDPATSSTAQTYTNGTTVSIGSGLALGQSITLKLYTILDGAAASNSYIFTRNVVTVNADANNLRIYQVMVESFMDGTSACDYNVGYGPSSHKGDLRGIINALPYIKELGCNALWMTPIFKSDGVSQLDGTGYFCRDYFQIDPKFGTLDDAKELVKKAHDLGMYVFLDGVFGHHATSGTIPNSPSGYTVVGSNPVSYPASLNFYKEVATYWIDTLEIDGWRLDQAYQVSTKNQTQNYWKDIRETVEAKCAARKAAGKQWGTLGYMVGEIWDGETNIQKWGYDAAGSAGLKSCFEFPIRYALVTVLAAKEHTDEANYKAQPASTINTAFTKIKSTYSSFAQPNLFLTNHDLVRFGDLIQRAGYGGKETTGYWKRYKAANTFLAAFTGPITLYYGDEIGDETPGVVGMNSGGYWDDTVARTNGQITGFDTKQQDLHDYVANLMKIRAAHPALWRGTRTNIIGDSATIYADLKMDSTEKVLYILNAAESSATSAISQSSIGGTSLVDLMTGATISASGSSYSVTIDGLSGRLLQVK